MNTGAPRATIERLCRYQQVLAQLERERVETASSADIGRLAVTNAAQVRKDFSHFGDFGRRGVGYSVSELRARLRAILGTENERTVVIIGAGNLGSALAGYPGFEMRGFRVVAIFDNNPAKIGHWVEGLRILPLSDLATVAAEQRIDIAVIAVPEAAAQAVADQVVEAGIKAILNFAPVYIQVPADVGARTVGVTCQLEYLSYFLAQSQGSSEAEES